METIITTAGETATNNNSVANVKAGKAVRTTSLKQQLTKAEKDLKNMVNSCAVFFDPQRLYPAAIEVELK